MSVINKYNKRVDEVNSLVCVGLDSDFDKLPEKFKERDNPQFEFNKWIIDETNEYVSAYKPNTAFYEARGDKGWQELKMTLDFLNKKYSDILTICDAKRADIGNTNKGYVKSILDWFNFDAVTLHPYLGGEALAPFLERDDKGCIILCRTSNPGAGELQDIQVDGKPIWKIVAEKVKNDWNKNNNCMLVVGATYPEEMKEIRSVIGDMTLLVPGIGAQGGDIEASVTAGLNSENKGMIINSSRGIIFSSNPQEEAKKLKDAINRFR
jgi:orotidine-5'-phosphate decarboxylase